jgi:hypothetical protein
MRAKSMARFHGSLNRLWSVKLGDPFTGYDAVAAVASTEEAVEWLRANAVRLYPDSTFAQLYSGFGPQ